MFFCFLNLKEKNEFYKIIKNIDNFSRLKKMGRLDIFFGPKDKFRLKEVPSYIGQASDLVIGLGISSAAAESYFSGTPAFHADLTRLAFDKFKIIDSNNAIFQDLNSLEQEIIKVINNNKESVYKKMQETYNYIDPFQDGMSYERIGFCLNGIQSMHSNGFSRKSIFQKLPKMYQDYLYKNNMNRYLNNERPKSQYNNELFEWK